MPVEIQSAQVHEVDQNNTIDQIYAEVFLQHPEDIPLEQVLTLQANPHDSSLFQSVVMNMDTHESRICVLQHTDTLSVYPWGTYP